MVKSSKASIQLWSCQYAPEPTGVGPVSASLARLLTERGWHVEVVAAHPHYPEPFWGRRIRPYREYRDGISVLRLPLWIGRASTAERLRQEFTFTTALMAALPTLSRPDGILVASPSFPALFPAIVNARVRHIPWVLWLHDVLPDGALATNLVDEGSLTLRLSRRLEQAAYSACDRVVVLSQPFRDNLVGKGVSPEKIELIYDPATRPAGFSNPDTGSRGDERPTILSMGNIGHTQGLAPLVRAFEKSELAHSKPYPRLVITGGGVAAESVAREIRSDSVEMVGILSDDRLDRELRNAALAFVSQQYEGTEFNLPSKLMNFMAYGLPVVAAVNPRSEVARIVQTAGAGWVVDSSRPDEFPHAVAIALASPEEMDGRGRAGQEYARSHFSPTGFGDRFDRVLESVFCSEGRGYPR